MKIVECPRCKGKGVGNWHVAHLGVPGLCYACDGGGKVAKLTMEERVQIVLRAKEKHLKELERIGKEWKDLPCRSETQLKINEARIERYRETWRQVNDRKKEIETTRKVTRDEHGATMPANQVPNYLLSEKIE